MSIHETFFQHRGTPAPPRAPGKVTVTRGGKARRLRKRRAEERRRQAELARQQATQIAAPVVPTIAPQQTGLAGGEALAFRRGFTSPSALPAPRDPRFNLAAAEALVPRFQGMGGIGLPTAPQFLSPGAAQAARFQGITPSSIIPRADIQNIGQRPFTIERAATQVIAGATGGLFGALAGSFGVQQQGGNLLEQFGGAISGAVEGARQLSGTAVSEDLLGLQGGQTERVFEGAQRRSMPPVPVAPLPGETQTEWLRRAQNERWLAAADDRPWWFEMPGGLGTFEEARQMLAAGVPLGDITPQVQIAFGLSDTALLSQGYVFDEATNKWVLVESQSLEDAQAGLAGPGVVGVGGGGGGGGGGGFSFPTAARSARGLGLTNWSI